MNLEEERFMLGGNVSSLEMQKEMQALISVENEL
jgi:hypothetical protein